MYFKSIQKLRGLAALSVFFYHVGVHLRVTGNNPDTLFRYINDNFGMDGVTLFFVISGFVMSYLLNSDTDWFLLKRVLRIYPPFLAATIFVCLFYLLVKGHSPSTKLYLALSLLPLGRQSYPLGVEWSLIYEIFFYVICSFFACNYFKRFFLYFLIVWLSAVYIAQHYYGASTLFLPTVRDIFFSAYNIPFILGGISFYIYKKVKRFAGWLDSKYLAVIFAGALALCTTHYMLAEFTLRILFFGAGIGLIVIVGTLRDVSNGNTGGKSLLEKLGDRSYGLYLLHVPVIVFIYNSMKAYYGKTNEVTGFIALALALILGWYFGGLDIFMHRVLKECFFGKREKL